MGKAGGHSKIHIEQNPLRGQLQRRVPPSPFLERGRIKCRRTFEMEKKGKKLATTSKGGVEGQRG